MSAPIEIPPDFVARFSQARVANRGWLSSGITYTGELEDRLSPVVAVRPGVEEVVTFNYVAAPLLDVRVVDAEHGSPIKTASLTSLLRIPGGAIRYGRGVRLNDRGISRQPLWLGVYLPEWSIEESTVLLVVRADGYETQVVKRPFTWDVVHAEVRLRRGLGRTWRLRGTLQDGDGKAVPGYQILVSPSAFPGAFSDTVKTDSQGGFHLDITEGKAPLYLEWGSAQFSPLVSGPKAGPNGKSVTDGFSAKQRSILHSFPASPDDVEPIPLTLHLIPE